MTNKKKRLSKPKVLESIGPGVMEYWSGEKNDINASAITPILQRLIALF
jgi:hypothetical protein